MSKNRTVTNNLAAAIACSWLIAAPVFAAADIDASTLPKLSEAEIWVQKRNDVQMPSTDSEKQSAGHKVKSFFKKAAHGAAVELKAEGSGLAKDMVLAFSVTDYDPYDIETAPKNRPAIVLKMTYIDGTSSFLRRFPDGSFAVEDGFADGTVAVPKRGQAGTIEYVIKYPNGAQGRVVRQGTEQITIYRPDNTVTTVKKDAAGSYTINNDKLGYMGSAEPDHTGLNYELKDW